MKGIIKGQKSVVCKNLRAYCREYCNSTSIHGFRYFGEKRSYIERGLWFIIFAICLSTCAYCISLIYAKWERSPVIVSFSTTETPIYEIPFPAVTICPETKSNKTRYDHSAIINKLLKNGTLTPSEHQRASYMDLICENDISKNLTSAYSRETETFNNQYYTENFFDFLNEVTPSPVSFFARCKIYNKNFRCSKYFTPIVTDEGICYTFNMLNLSMIYSNDVVKPKIRFFPSNVAENNSWDPDTEYENPERLTTYPQRALYSGVEDALDLHLTDSAAHVDHLCKFSTQGFKVILHAPMRVPRLGQDYFRVPPNEQVLAAIQPVMIKTTDSVKKFYPDKRKCYFQKEKPLKYFQIYSQHNCNLECLTDLTYDLCKCVTYFMPRNNGTNICGLSSKECMENVGDIFQLRHLKNILVKKHKRNNFPSLNFKKVPNCNCLPLCTDITYNVETSSSRWEWKNAIRAVNDTRLWRKMTKSGVSISRLIIYFKSSQFVTSERHELYGPTDFLGNFGGLLGLFTGFSILSLMELIYFLTLRILCNIRLYGRWSGRE